MKPVVLLSGDLGSQQFDEAWREVETYSRRGLGRRNNNAICLVISSEGGQVQAGLGFIKKMRESALKFEAKIYRASSLAALIALTTQKRTIVKGGELMIHLGILRVEANEIDSCGRVSAQIRDLLTALKTETLALLAEAGFPGNGKPMSDLIITGHLKLDAKKCKELGLVNDVI